MVAVGVAAVGCGGDPGVGAPADAAPARARRLVLLDPPGESVGILFGSSETLRVRLENVDGFPVAGAPVEFAFFVSAAETTGGAALSSRSAITDDSGIARVTVSAGAERANFRVRTSAENATPVTFFVAVSELGFADLRVTPAHLGFRDAASFARIELRMYRHGIFQCDQLEPDFPPDTVFPIKSLPGFGGAATFRKVSALEPYTLLAWAEVVERGTPVAVGCATIGAQQILPGPGVSVQIVLEDRALGLPDSTAIDSVLDLTPVADAAKSAGAVDAWTALACPVGPGQLILDRVVAAAGEDLAADIEPLRGVVDIDTGCRGVEDSEGGQSIDRLVSIAVGDGGAFPVGDDLAEVVAMRRAIATSVRLRSAISAVAPGVVAHRVLAAQLGADGASHDIDLTASARPVLAQSQIPITVDGGTGAAFGAHQFTLRLGPASRAAFVALGLAPAGLADRADDLGTALIGSVQQDATTGCDALSALVCDAIAAPGSCIAAACIAAAAELDTDLDAWWQIYAADGLDLALSGAATLSDFDHDLQVDTLTDGTWTATLATTTGPIATTGTFATPAEVTE